ncbi:reticulon/nogo receptor [Anopheles darlingi]|uniref:Reticulon/nogo receptor n=1 Tax=Anopheles darlingi TaxID=43151 RepID=W5JPC6_ANODA|nr:reticulon/nogo receptor [Anopheles darlingi]
MQTSSMARNLAQVLLLGVLVTLPGTTYGRSFEKQTMRKGKSAQIVSSAPTITTPLMDLCSEDINMKLACHCSPESHTKAQKASCSIFDGELPRKDYNWLAFHTQTELEHLKFTVRKSGNLTYIPSDVISTLARLRTLTIEYGIIADIYPFAFGNLTELRVINLPNNQIVTLHANSFANHRSLEELMLENNYIKKIDRDAFVNVPKLIKLNLANNSLVNLHDNGFEELTKLEELRLESNRISILAREYFKGLENLKILKLSYNDVEYVGAFVFADLWSLQMLFLDSNRIQKLDERAFDGLTSLNYLHLENNRITTIDSATFTSVSALQLLNLDSNHLTTMTYGHIVPLMDNLVNSSALLSLRDNHLICDCRLAWMYDLNERTRNEELRENLKSIECMMGLPAAEEPTAHSPLASMNEFGQLDDDGDYIDDSASENDALAHEQPQIVNVLKVGREELPCPEELAGPTGDPNPRESKGLFNLPWNNSAATGTRHYSSSGLLLLTLATLCATISGAGGWCSVRRMLSC